MPSGTRLLDMLVSDPLLSLYYQQSLSIQPFQDTIADLRRSSGDCSLGKVNVSPPKQLGKR
jgi:hypothetical protein